MYGARVKKIENDLWKCYLKLTLTPDRRLSRAAACLGAEEVGERLDGPLACEGHVEAFLGQRILPTSGGNPRGKHLFLGQILAIV